MVTWRAHIPYAGSSNLPCATTRILVPDLRQVTPRKDGGNGLQCSKAGDSALQAQWLGSIPRRSTKLLGSSEGRAADC